MRNQDKSGDFAQAAEGCGAGLRRESDLLAPNIFSTEASAARKVVSERLELAAGR